MEQLKAILLILGLWLTPITKPVVTFIIGPAANPAPITTNTTTTEPPIPITTTTTVPPPPRTTTTLAVVVEPIEDVWWSLALCEDGGKNRWFEPYSGYFHFLPSTYHSVGGTGYPHDDDYETQKGFAIKLQKSQGWNPWPGCARKLGLPLR